MKSCGVSKDNYLKPKIKLTQKVACDGSQVEYVTGFNASIYCKTILNMERFKDWVERKCDSAYF